MGTIKNGQRGGWWMGVEIKTKRSSVGLGLGMGSLPWQLAGGRAVSCCAWSPDRWLEWSPLSAGSSWFVDF